MVTMLLRSPLFVKQDIDLHKDFVWLVCRAQIKQGKSVWKCVDNFPVDMRMLWLKLLQMYMFFISMVFFNVRLEYA